MNRFLAYCICLFLSFLTKDLVAQRSKEAIRYEIDAKRMGVNMYDQEALYSSREFIRLDSTYYVGYLLQGLYFFEKSSDYLGFKNSINSLRRSLNLIEKDFRPIIQNIFASPPSDFNVYGRYNDLLTIAATMKEAYENIEMADSVIWIINKIESYKFPEDRLHFTTAKAWTYHRNRFYTSEKYSFLKNSIAENEKMAIQFCHQAMNKTANPNDLFSFSTDNLYAYHNLSIIHAYLKNYDSSEYYYQQLQQSGAMSYNNYGLLQQELGNFGMAKQYIQRSLGGYNKHLQEPVYYIPMLEVYSGKLRQAINLTKTTITQNGSTPGFGWYNLSLARSYLYNGQLDSSEYALDKAANFKELHIGTTLTQTQYDLTINLLELQLTEKKIQLIKFQNKGWWYSPSALYDIASLKVEKMLLQYVLVNQLMNNPERDRLVYDLFCSESTTTFDEAYFLIKDFSVPYFIKKYKAYQQNDPRANVKRYFRLFEAKLELEDGDEEDAAELFENIFTGEAVDTEAEKLFLGRLFEGMSVAYDEDGNDEKSRRFANELLETYPQLIPFSGIKMRMKLVSTGLNDDVTEEVIDELKKCRIKWVEENNTALVQINFAKGSKYEATINVRSASGRVIVNNEKILFKENDEGVGSEIAVRLFGKSGSMVFEKAESYSKE